MSAYRKLAKNKNQDLAVRHLGIIAGRCLFYWKYLPPSARVFYTADDMIGDVVLHVVRVTHKYNATKARESTWVHHVASNSCKRILARYNTQKVNACTTVEISPTITKKLAVEDTRCREAKDAVERVIEFGSETLCDLLSKILSGEVRNTSPEVLEAYVTNDYELVQEFRRIAARCRATREDFELVLHHVVA